MKQKLILIMLCVSVSGIFAQKATWIYYPGDFEIWLGNDMQNRRTERGAFFPPFWKMDSHYVLVEFSKKLDLAKTEKVTIAVEGKYNVKLDGKLLPGNPSNITIPEGKHSLNIKVHNQANVPSVYVQGETFGSDNTWQVTFEDKEWIDESGKASDTSSGTVYLNAGAWNFDKIDTPPSKFKLQTTPLDAVKSETKGNGLLVDFGKETFGFIQFKNLEGVGKMNIYYGESPEEGLAKETCETLDFFEINNPEAKDFPAPPSPPMP